MQVTISYVDALEPRESRQLALRQRYCFNCGCGRCRQLTPAADDYLSAISVSADVAPERGLELVADVEMRLQAAIDRGAQLFLVEVQRL